jgi:site-specific DNA-methyltransferase (adenine-specific)
MELYNDDCFNVFPKIKDKSINLFLLDLPYGQTACKWDSVIDLDKMWIEIKRMMKPNGIIVFFCTAKFGYTLIQSNEKWFKYDLIAEKIWKKSRKVGFLSANKMPLRQHENIYVFKKEQGTYNPQKTEGKPYNKTNTGNNNDDNCAYGTIDRASHLEGDGNRKINTGDRHPTSIIEHENLYVFKKEQGTYNPQKTPRDKDYKHSGKRSSEDHYGNVLECKKEYKKEDGKYPTSIIENTILEYNNPAKSLHRTQKPVELCEWLIKTYTNEDDVVMDFTMGSGTTGIACSNTNRDFIGVEMDKEIFEIAEKRILEHLS